MSSLTQHLSNERIQDLLDGRLAGRDAAGARAHLAECGLCRAELEGWRTLLTELSELPALTPRPGFGGRVLGGMTRPVPEALPLAARIRATLASWLDRVRVPGAQAHPDAVRLQDFVEGALGHRPAAVLRRHLAECDGCRMEARRWATLVRELNALPRLSPSPGFAQAVMRGLVPTPMSAHGPIRRLLVRARAVASPRRRRAWAAAAGIALTPTVTAGVIAYAVFSHPLVTVGNLVAFAWLKASAFASVVGGGSVGALMESAATFRAWAAIAAVSGSPMAAGAGLLGFCALTLGSGWVVYRNVIAPIPEVARVER